MDVRGSVRVLKRAADWLTPVLLRKHCSGISSLKMDRSSSASGQKQPPSASFPQKGRGTISLLSNF